MSRRRRIFIRDIGSIASSSATGEPRNYLDMLDQSCTSRECHEREQLAELEFHKLRETLHAVKSDKDKEIAFLRGQLAAYSSMATRFVPLPANPFAVSPSKPFPGPVVTTQAAVVWGSPVASKTSSKLALFGEDCAKSPPRNAFEVALSMAQLGSPGSSPAITFGAPPPPVPAEIGSPQRFGESSQGGAFSIGVAPPVQPPTAKQILRARLHKQNEARLKSRREDADL